MTRLLGLQTTRTSVVIRAFLERYPDALVTINLMPEHRTLEVWCTNRQLKGVRDFSVVSDGIEVLAFHDGWRNMWAHESAAPLVDDLAQQRLLRYTIDTPIQKRGFFSRLLQFIGA